jgi:AraC family transcriptional activator of pobA
MKNFISRRKLYESLALAPQETDDRVSYFNIFRIENLAVQQKKPLLFSRRSYFKISLVSGHSRVHFADQSIEITESAVVFTNPLIPYSWERIGKQQTGSMIIFNDVFIGPSENLQDYPAFKSAVNAVTRLSGDNFDHFEKRFKRIECEYKGDYQYRFALLRILLLELIHETQKINAESDVSMFGKTAYERLYLFFCKLLESAFSIETNYHTLYQLTPAYFAERLNIHVNHLNKVLKEITGQTTSQLISSRFVQEATILLKNSDWSINEIAWALGFDEPNHFSSFIKKHTGLSPSRYRVAND